MLYKKTSQHKVTLFLGLYYCNGGDHFSLCPLLFFLLQDFNIFLNRIIYLFFDLLVGREERNSTILITISVTLFNLEIFASEMYICNIRNEYRSETYRDEYREVGGTTKK